MQRTRSVKEQKDSKIEVSHRQKPGGNFSKESQLTYTESSLVSVWSVMDGINFGVSSSDISFKYDIHEIKLKQYC